jgi:glycosyltransferase involved in cell wall biosynthesis
LQTKGSRIAFIFLSVFSHEGGIQSYVKDILNAYLVHEKLPAADIYVLRDRPTDTHPLAKAAKFNFYCFGDNPPSVGRLKLGGLLFQQLLTQQYSRIICGHVLVTPLVSPLSQLFQIPYTVMTYGKEVWETVPPLQRRALRRAHDIWTISRYSRDLACAANAVNPQKFRMLPPVVDGQLFTPGEKNPELLARYRLHDCRVLMTVARLWSGDIYKGVDVTIRALPDILKVFPEVKYLVVGRGDDQPRLAKLAADLGVGDRVVFAGFVPNDVLVDHYRLADAYVMPSKERP